jgi:tetratricopeptide (TPR) repeat protein
MQPAIFLDPDPNGEYVCESQWEMMRPRRSEIDVTGWGDEYALGVSEEDAGLDVLVDDYLDQPPPQTFTDVDVTPAMDTFRDMERACVSEQRWEDLVGLFVERSATTVDPAERTRCLVRAAQLYDTNLGDSDSAFVTLLAALQEDPSNDDLLSEMGRLATVHNRWEDLIGMCNSVLIDIPSGAKRADLLVTMAVWYQRDLGDQAAAERSLEAAMSANPANFTALRSLVLLHGQRGDWHRAAAYLTCAAGNAIDPFDSVDFALDAAEIYRDQLHDIEAAVVQYMRVLTLSPNHPTALAALADAAWERSDWTAAAPLLEGMAGSAKHAVEETAQLWHKAAWSAQMSGDMERARANYRKAYSAQPTHVETLKAWSKLAGAWSWWQDILTTVPRLLSLAGDQMPGEERAGHLMQLGQAHVAMRDLQAGTASFMEALRLAPDLPGVRQALAQATAQMEGRGSANAMALVEQYRVILHGQIPPDEQFEIMCKIGRLQRDELHDKAAALGTYLQAAQLRPNDVGVLHELVEIHTANRHWSRAVDVLEKLVSVTSGRDKVCYLGALASILNVELDSPMEAVALYDRALDEDPTDRRTFEHIEHILIRREEWRELARAYRRMIKRLGASPQLEKRPLLLTLWRALADTCRRYLGDLPAATAAYEVCMSLAPEDAQAHEALAEAYEAQGRDGYSRAVAAREHLLRRVGSADAIAKQIRALARLFGKYRQYDPLFCASAALCALTKADPRERAFYEGNAPKGILQAKFVLTEKQWQGHLCSSRENHMISQVMAAVAPGMIMARAKDALAYGIEAKYRATVEGDSSFVSRLLVYVSRLLGVPLPAIYVPPGAPGEIDLVVLLEDGKPVPALVLGRDLVVGRSQQELAFLLTKKVVGLRADHFLLWPQIVPNLSELQAILAAAIKLVQPKFELPEADHGAVRKYVSYLHKVLPATQIELIAGAVAPLLAGTFKLDLAAWLAESDESANRAGVLACGDVVAAAREIVREARAHHTRPEQTILNLARWGVCSDYLDLRAHLGLAMVVAESSTPPLAHSFSELGGLFDQSVVRG